MATMIDMANIKLTEQHHAIVHELMTGLSKLGFTVISANELLTIVQSFVKLSIAYLTEKKSNCESIGKTLAELHFLRPNVLGEFQKVLYQSIYRHFSDDEKQAFCADLLQLLADVAKGYNQSAINLVLKEQEEIRFAHIQQVEKVRKDFENLYDKLETLVAIRTRELSDANQKLADEIQNHKLAEIALVESESRYRTLAESAHDFIFIIDKNDTVEYANKQAGRLFNCQPEQLIGRNRSELFGETTNKQQKDALQKVLKTGESLHAQGWIDITSEKSIYLDTLLAPITENNTIHSVLGISRDITIEKIADQKIAEQEKKYHSLFDKIYNAILLIDDGIVIDCNSSTKSVFGLSPDKINGKAFLKLLKKSERANKHFIDQFQQQTDSCLSGNPQQFEIDYSRDDGEFLNLEIHMTRFPEGEDWRILTVVRNITPYKQALRAYQTSEMRFRDIIKRSIDGYYFVNTDYQIGAMNDAAREITSFTKEQINNYLVQGAEDKRAESVYKILKKVMGGESIEWEELEFIDINGEKRWMALNARRVYNAGKVSGVEGFIKNITARKNTGIKLLESEARYKALFENTPYDVFGLTIDKRFVKVNQNFMNCWGDLDGRKLSALVPRSFSTKISELCNKAATNSSSIEGSYFHKSDAKHYRIIIAPNITEDKHIIGYAGLIIDVTEAFILLQEKRKFAEALIQSSEDEQRRISREIHDSLGQLLFALQVELSAIKLNFCKDAADVDDIFLHAEGLLTKSMHEASNMCHRLHPRLLDDFGLHEALEDLVESVKKVGLFEISFLWQLEKPQLTKNEETAIFRVVQEALANVLKHSQASRVELALQRHENGIKMTIKDNGHGFKTAIKENSKSRGLGLLNMKERIELIDGVFRIESSLGCGVYIEILIPK
jgi:PAS domain S-box-containing protein